MRTVIITISFASFGISCLRRKGKHYPDLADDTFGQFCAIMNPEIRKNKAKTLAHIPAPVWPFEMKPAHPKTKPNTMNIKPKIFVTFTSLKYSG